VGDAALEGNERGQEDDAGGAMKPRVEPAAQPSASAREKP
jgi:hypothetical protein